MHPGGPNHSGESAGVCSEPKMSRLIVCALLIAGAFVMGAAWRDHGDPR